MRLHQLIKRNLAYFRKRNLFLALGIAVSTAVLTGALIVGDSVKFSLNRIVENRLGMVTHVMKSGDRYFTTSLADSVSENHDIETSPVLLLDAIASADGGQRRINNTQVIGIDHTFGRVVGFGEFFSEVEGEEVIISNNLASRLAAGVGDEILLRITRASLIPLNAPFVSDADNIVSLRVTVKGIADADHLGSFNLRISQTSPFNIFISLVTLNEIMELDGRANSMIIAGTSNRNDEEIMDMISKEWSIADAGLQKRSLENLNLLEITSQRVFLDDGIATRLENIKGLTSKVITYFVNSIETGNDLTPYSFVSTLPDSWLRKDEIIINNWLAQDLNASAGDSLKLTYFSVGPLRELIEDSAMFVISSVVPMEGLFADRNLMPDLPGLSDAGSCRDWETGVPVNLESIRDKDEDYWNVWSGTPKAFVSVTAASALWQNRFGTFTAMRFDASETDIETIESALLSDLSPEDIGFRVESVRSNGYFAAQNGVDFSQLFGGLSFFLIVAGIILIVVLFLLNLESRKEQLQILISMGIPAPIVRRSLIFEGMVVALAGTIIGLLLSFLYNKLVFIALNGVWRDIVRTEMMVTDIRLTTLAAGMITGLVISWIVLFFPLNRFLNRHIRKHQTQFRRRSILNPSRILALSIVSGTAGVLLILFQFILGDVVNPSIFFAAGSLLLLSSILLASYRLQRPVSRREKSFRLSQLSHRNLLRNRTRSMSIITLFAIGTFLVISTGSNRKDLFRGADDPSSGTGGFLYFAESTVPVLHRLNDPGVRTNFGLDGDYSFVQMRKASGDDASCLNLNKIVNPQIAGVDPAQLDGRFSFVTTTGYLDEAQPWLSLESELPGGLIPAIADETVIKWGLGLKVGDTLKYRNKSGETMELLLIGGLAPSIFQGNVLISDSRFLQSYPHSSGTEMFLIDGSRSDTAIISSELQRGMRDFGWEMTLSAERLAEFNSVTNTYLSIFLVMGALGLLIGTIGLAVVLVRSILERRKEIAILKALGYPAKKIRGMIFNEYMALLRIGIGAGFISAVVATLPAFISPNSDISFISILWILLLLLVNGWVWIYLVTRNALGKLPINEALRND